MAKKPTGRAVGSFVPQITRKALEKFGFPAAAILTDWPAIAGADLAGWTQPERLRWPKRAGDSADGDNPWHGAEGATLILRAEGPRVLELQHRTQQIIDKVNAYFGFRAVTEVRLLQAPLAKAKPKKPKLVQAPAVPIPPAEVADDALRDVLSRMGGNVKRKSTALGA